MGCCVQTYLIKFPNDFIYGSFEFSFIFWIIISSTLVDKKIYDENFFPIYLPHYFLLNFWLVYIYAYIRTYLGMLPYTRNRSTFWNEYWWRNRILSIFVYIHYTHRTVYLSEILNLLKVHDICSRIHRLGKMHLFFWNATDRSGQKQ